MSGLTETCFKTCQDILTVLVDRLLLYHINQLKNIKMKTLENTISRIAGIKVEITILGENYFSFFFLGENNEAAYKIKKFFKNQGAFDSNIEEYDKECDSTCLFFVAKK